jgi:hypothetical protein
VPLELEDFQRISDSGLPLPADLKPSGKYVQEDLPRPPAGTPALKAVSALSSATCTATR